MGLDDTVERLVHRFRLAAVAGEHAANLSYGQQKLLDTAMALVSPRRGVPRRAGRRSTPP